MLALFSPLKLVFFAAPVTLLQLDGFFFFWWPCTAVNHFFSGMKREYIICQSRKDPGRWTKKINKTENVSSLSRKCANLRKKQFVFPFHWQICDWGASINSFLFYYSNNTGYQFNNSSGKMISLHLNNLYLTLKQSIFYVAITNLLSY